MLKFKQNKTLLIVTQKVDKNDPILGFFHRWIDEFSKQFEKVTVICLEKGQFDLSTNVEVISLGKEEGHSLLKYLARFYFYISTNINKYDAVFVHMNPMYIILAGPIWRTFGKKINLWYVHKNVDLKLRIAEKICHRIFTASAESFRLKSKKVEIVGHGIDLNKFSPIVREKNVRYSILSVGRISKTKNQLAVVEAIKRLQLENFPVTLTLVGAGITKEDGVYERRLREFVCDSNLNEIVELTGNISPDFVSRRYQVSDMLVNLSDTGSMDKVVLEAMACGLQVLTSNESFKNVVPTENFTSMKPDEIARKIVFLSKRKIDNKFREYVIANHNIENLIPRLSQKMKQQS